MLWQAYLIISSVQFSHSVVSDSLWPHGPQHARPPCPSPTPGVHPDSCALSWWCHPTISSSVIPFSSCPQSLYLIILNAFLKQEKEMATHFSFLAWKTPCTKEPGGLKSKGSQRVSHNQAHQHSLFKKVIPKDILITFKFYYALDFAKPSLYLQL